MSSPSAEFFLIKEFFPEMKTPKRYGLWLFIEDLNPSKSVLKAARERLRYSVKSAEEAHGKLKGLRYAVRRGYRYDVGDGQVLVGTAVAWTAS